MRGKATCMWLSNCISSPPTCLRRVRRLHALGLIERQVAIVRPKRWRPWWGMGLQALVEVTLERQHAEALDEFEALAVAEDGVQQCWRVSPGPDFVLVVACSDMPAYWPCRNAYSPPTAMCAMCKTFFATKRAKFSPQPAATGTQTRKRLSTLQQILIATSAG